MKIKVLLLLLFTIYTGYSQKVITENSDGLIFQDLFYTAKDNKGPCYRIPAIVTAPNGNLIAAIDERVLGCGDLKYNKDINIAIRISKNNGKSWSSIKKIVDYPLGESASDPSMIVDAVTGEIFLFFNYMNLNTEKDIYYLKYIKSSNNGRTWSKPIDITSQITKKDWHNDFKFISSGRGTQTRSGKLIHTLVNLQKGMHVFGSDDHGKSWYLINTPIKPADESKIIELSDGSWMINSRVQKEKLRYIHSSTDQGLTWTSYPDNDLIDPNCNASIVSYSSVKNGAQKNRLIFSNPASKKGRENLTVRISYDEGKTWSQGKTIYRGSAAYSSLTVLKNGNIGLFFERDGYTKNTFVQFSLAWLTDGKDSQL